VSNAGSLGLIEYFLESFLVTDIVIPFDVVPMKFAEYFHKDYFAVSGKLP
jgi:hypothetical protein